MQKVLIYLLVLNIYSCKKDKIKITSPTLETQAVVEILDQTAKSGGKIIYDGGGAITAKGLLLYHLKRSSIFYHLLFLQLL